MPKRCLACGGSVCRDYCLECGRPSWKDIKISNIKQKEDKMLSKKEIEKRALSEKDIDEIPGTIFIAYRDKDLKKWVLYMSETYNAYGRGWKDLIRFGMSEVAIARKLNLKTEIKLLQQQSSAKEIEDIGFKEVNLDSL